MAYTDSSIGYASVVLSDPPPNSDSAIGYAVVALSDPAPVTYSDSQIGYDVVALTDPAPLFSDSSIGFAVVLLRDPVTNSDSPIGFTVVNVGYVHRPVSVFMADGSLRRVPIRTWDGTTPR